MNPRTTFVLISLLLLLAGGFWLYEVNKIPERGDLPAPWFYNFSVDEINEIKVTADGKTVSFIKESQMWSFNDDEKTPVDQYRWGGIPLLVSGPQSMRYIPNEELENDLSSYGLSDPLITIEITLENGSQFQSFLGEKDPAMNNYYGRFPESEGIFLIDSLWGDVISNLAIDPPIPLTPTIIPAPTN